MENIVYSFLARFGYSITKLLFLKSFVSTIKNNHKINLKRKYPSNHHRI